MIIDADRTAARINNPRSSGRLISSAYQLPTEAVPLFSASPNVVCGLRLFAAKLSLGMVEPIICPYVRRDQPVADGYMGPNTLMWALQPLQRYSG